MANHKIVWSTPEGRFLLVDADTMTLHVLKLEAGAQPALPLPEAQTKELRPLDWASAPRIVGPTNLEPFAKNLVDQCWDQVSQVALIFINAPDKWPARTSFHAQASARGSAFSPHGNLGADSPLDAFGVGGLLVPKLSNEIRTRGKFANLDDLTKRVRETSRELIRRNVVQIILNELTTAPKAAMFFARRDNKIVFRTQAGAQRAKPEEDEDDDEGDFRPPRRY